MFFLICKKTNFFIFQIATLAQGKSWDEKKSSAQKFNSGYISPSQSNSTSTNNYNSSSSSYQSYNNSENYQGGYQNYNSTEFKDQKDQFFARKQVENANKRE